MWPKYADRLANSVDKVYILSTLSAQTCLSENLWGYIQELKKINKDIVLYFLKRENRTELHTYCTDGFQLAVSGIFGCKRKHSECSHSNIILHTTLSPFQSKAFCIISLANVEHLHKILSGICTSTSVWWRIVLIEIVSKWTGDSLIVFPVIRSGNRKRFDWETLFDFHLTRGINNLSACLHSRYWRWILSSRKWR